MAYARAALTGLKRLLQKGGVAVRHARGARPRQDRAGCGPDQVCIAFLPQCCCDTGRVTGLRIVTRVAPPDGEPVPIEEVQDLLPADMLTDSLMAGLRLALAAVRRWDRLGVGPALLTLPLSEGMLADPGLVQEILWELDRQNIVPSRIEIEFPEPASEQIGRLRMTEGILMLSRAGCRIAMGEFGTGHADRDLLRSLGVRRVRIGRRFIAGCDSGTSRQRMILAVLALAEHMNLESLADGVATAEERAFLTQIGFSAVQGEAVWPALPAAGIDQILLGQRETVVIPLRLQHLG